MASIFYCLRANAGYFVTILLHISVLLSSSTIVIEGGEFPIFWPDIHAFTCLLRKVTRTSLIYNFVKSFKPVFNAAYAILTSHGKGIKFYYHFYIFFTMRHLICQCPYLPLLFIFQKRMHQIMTTCFHSVRQKLHRRTGTFDLLGFDFLIDEDFKVSLPLYMISVSHSAFKSLRK